jgi:hypothetical protein
VIITPTSLFLEKILQGIEEEIREKSQVIKENAHKQLEELMNATVARTAINLATFVTVRDMQDHLVITVRKEK